MCNRIQRTAAIVAMLASIAAAASAAQAASTSFAGKVCPVVNAKLVAKLGFTMKCTEVKPISSPVGTVDAATWVVRGTSQATHRSLTIQVWTSSFPGFKARFEKQASGTPVKVGEWAREGLTSGGVELRAWVHGHGLWLILTDVKKGRSEAETVAAIAKSAASKL